MRTLRSACSPFNFDYFIFLQEMQNGQTNLLIAFLISHGSPARTAVKTEKQQTLLNQRNYIILLIHLKR